MISSACAVAHAELVFYYVCVFSDKMPPSYPEKLLHKEHPSPLHPPSRGKGGQRFFAWEYLTAAAAAFSFKSRNLSEPLLREIRERVINFCARKVAFRSAPQFADTSAYGERCSGARYNCCHCAPQENRTQSRRRTLGFSKNHDFFPRRFAEKSVNKAPSQSR